MLKEDLKRKEKLLKMFGILHKMKMRKKLRKSKSIRKKELGKKLRKRVATNMMRKL
jgi:hypothetical protein